MFFNQTFFFMVLAQDFFASELHSTLRNITEGRGNLTITEMVDALDTFAPLTVDYYGLLIILFWMLLLFAVLRLLFRTCVRKFAANIGRIFLFSYIACSFTLMTMLLVDAERVRVFFFNLATWSVYSFVLRVRSYMAAFPYVLSRYFRGTHILELIATFCLPVVVVALLILIKDCYYFMKSLTRRLDRLVLLESYVESLRCEESYVVESPVGRDPTTKAMLRMQADYEHQLEETGHTQVSDDWGRSNVSGRQRQVVFNMLGKVKPSRALEFTRAVSTYAFEDFDVSGHMKGSVGLSKSDLERKRDELLSPDRVDREVDNLYEDLLDRREFRFAIDEESTKKVLRDMYIANIRAISEDPSARVSGIAKAAYLQTRMKAKSQVVEEGVYEDLMKKYHQRGGKKGSLFDVINEHVVSVRDVRTLLTERVESTRSLVEKLAACSSNSKPVVEAIITPQQPSVVKIVPFFAPVMITCGTSVTGLCVAHRQFSTQLKIGVFVTSHHEKIPTNVCQMKFLNGRTLDVMCKHLVVKTLHGDATLTVFYYSADVAYDMPFIPTNVGSKQIKPGDVIQTINFTADCGYDVKEGTVMTIADGEFSHNANVTSYFEDLKKSTKSREKDNKKQPGSCGSPVYREGVLIGLHHAQFGGSNFATFLPNGMIPMTGVEKKLVTSTEDVFPFLPGELVVETKPDGVHYTRTGMPTIKSSERSFYVKNPKAELLHQYSTHRIVRPSTDDACDAAYRVSAGDSTIPLKFLQFAIQRYASTLDIRGRREYTIDETIRAGESQENYLNPKSMCGYPYGGHPSSRLYSGELCDFLQRQTLFEDCLEVEVDTGTFFTFFPKTDGYNDKKINGSLYRVIMGKDRHLLVCMVRKLAWLNNSETMPEFFGKMSPENWHSKLKRHYQAGGWGGDVGRMDGSIPEEVVRYVTYMLCRIGGMTKAMSRSIADILATASGVDMHGNYVPRLAGNPSGNYLTTKMNGIVSVAVIAASLASTCGIDVQDFEQFCKLLNDFSVLVSGDDNLITPRCPLPGGFCDAFVSWMAYYGFEYKIDLDVSRGHAVFLSMYSVVHDGYLVAIPATPARMLKTLIWVPQAGLTDANLIEKIEGVYVSLCVFRLVRYGLQVEVPACVVDFFDYAHSVRGVNLIDDHTIALSRLPFVMCTQQPCFCVQGLTTEFPLVSVFVGSKLKIQMPFLGKLVVSVQIRKRRFVTNIARVLSYLFPMMADPSLVASYLAHSPKALQVLVLTISGKMDVERSRTHMQQCWQIAKSRRVDDKSHDDEFFRFAMAHLLELRHLVMAFVDLTIVSTTANRLGNLPSRASKRGWFIFNYFAEGTSSLTCYYQLGEDVRSFVSPKRIQPQPHGRILAMLRELYFRDLEGLDISGSALSTHVDFPYRPLVETLSDYPDFDSYSVWELFVSLTRRFSRDVAFTDYIDTQLVSEKVSQAIREIGVILNDW